LTLLAAGIDPDELTVGEQIALHNQLMIAQHFAS
jgi:hypothetical protein